MKNSFKEGDEVQLKSGGPKMTVEEVDGENITCIWFDSKNTPQHKTFIDATLKLYQHTIGARRDQTLEYK